MSLVVWLPLDGDLRNLGASDLQFTNENATNITIDNNGKIGKCYKRSAVKTAGRIIADKTLNLDGDLSMCCWAKVTTTVGDTANGLISLHSHANNTGFGITVKQVSTTDYRISCSTGNGSSRTYCSYYGTTNIKDAWHHLTLTYNNTLKQFKLWVDGKVEYTLNYTNASRAEILMLFEWSTTYNAVDYRPACLLNDVRIYNHCLSAAEVKEIAQGLVLHYKLDKNKSQLVNVYNYPTFDTSNSGGGWNHWGQSGASGAYGQNTDKKYIWNKNNTYSHWVSNSSSATGHYLLYQSPAFDGGYRSTQCIVKEENGLPITTSIVYAKWNARSGGLTNDTFSSITHLGDGFYLCKAEGIKQDGSNDLIGFYVKPGYKVYFSEAYLENNKEMCSDVFEQDNLTTIEDSSGYGHNGEIINSLTTLADTPRYSRCTHISATNQKIKISGLTTSGFGNSYSFVWWEKISDNYAMSWGFNDGIRLNGIFYHTLWNTGDSSANPLYKPGTTTQVSAPSTGVWHHYAMVGDGSTCKVYLDGEFWAQAKTYKAISGTTIYINGWDTSTNYSSNDLSISDFRIYCTPLLDTDIKLLYNMGMRVDNLGGVHTFELNENSSKNKLTKTGVLNNNIIEPYLTLPDGSNWKLILYHYVDNGNNLFTSSNATDCNDFGLYSRLKDINNYTYNSKYEFYVNQDGKEFRWTQTSQPTASSIAGLTTVEGYNNPVNGLAKANQSNTYIGYDAWWGACGCWTKYSTGGKTGIPGFGSHDSNGICEKYLALYVRVEKNNASFENSSANSTEFIEI